DEKTRGVYSIPTKDLMTPTPGHALESSIWTNSSQAEKTHAASHALLARMECLMRASRSDKDPTPDMRW
ncbi:Hypothetical protein FKW44_017782, partial [Caligus rogercresseyi]